MLYSSPMMHSQSDLPGRLDYYSNDQLKAGGDKMALMSEIMKFKDLSVNWKRNHQSLSNYLPRKTGSAS